MLKDAFYTSKSLDHICTVVVQVPQLAIMALVCPPEWILFQDLILLEFRSNSPPLIIRQSMSVLLKQRIDTRYASVPTVLQILQCESPVLCIGLLSLQCILSPHTL